MWSTAQQHAVLAHWRAATARRCQLHEAASAVIARMMHRSLAAAWSMWRSEAQTQSLKRAAFARKQATLRAALEVGNAIARARQRELTALCFGSWHYRMRMCAFVQRRMEDRLRCSASGAFSAWQVYCRRAAARRRQRVICYQHAQQWAARRALARWREALAGAATARQGRLALAAAHAFASAMRAAFARWQIFVACSAQQRQKLGALLASLERGGAAGLPLPECLARWSTAVQAARWAAARAAALAAKHDSGLLSSVFDTWSAYARAMCAADPSPSSPFASPRGRSSDERLAWGMAAIAAGASSCTTGSGDSGGSRGGSFSGGQHTTITVLPLGSRASVCSSVVDTSQAQDPTTSSGRWRLGGVAKRLFRRGSGGRA